MGMQLPLTPPVVKRALHRIEAVGQEKPVLHLHSQSGKKGRKATYKPSQNPFLIALRAYGQMDQRSQLLRLALVALD